MRAAKTAPLMLCLVLLAASPAFAQNSTQAPPASAGKEGSVQGDPTGAIRSLEGSSTSGSKSDDNEVVIPQLGARNGGAARTGGVPMGTTR